MYLCAVFLGILFINGAPEKTVNLTLTEPEVAYVLNSLSKEPKKEVDGLYNKIYNQAVSQLTDTTKPKK